MMSGIIALKKDRFINQIVDVHVDAIHLQPEQYQLDCSAETLRTQAEEIMRSGVRQPFSLRRTESGYELISDLRQYYAAKLAGLKYVPCQIMDSDTAEHTIFTLVEQIKKQKLNLFQEADAIEKLITNHGLTQEDAASYLGKAQSTIANKLRLLRLTEEERYLVLKHHLTERHARALLRLGSAQERMKILHRVIEEGLNVEKTESAIEQILGEQRPREPYRKRCRTVQNARTYIQTIRKVIAAMEDAGIDVHASQLQDESSIEFRIQIPYRLRADGKENTQYH